VSAKGFYSPDYFLASGAGVYLTGSLAYAVPNTPVSLTGTVGHQSIETNTAFGTPDYMDYSVGGSVSALGVSIGAALVGTDVDDADCFAGSELCKTRAVFSLSRGL
jgi:hypothetical protein